MGGGKAQLRGKAERHVPRVASRNAHSLRPRIRSLRGNPCKLRQTISYLADVRQADGREAARPAARLRPALVGRASTAGISAAHQPRRDRPRAEATTKGASYRRT